MPGTSDDTTQPELHVEDVVPRSDAESIDPVQERRALARLQSKLFGRSEAPLKIGRYELGRKLGSGGMGVVYEAEDPSLHRRIAIKLVRGRSAHALQNAIVEARALAALSEPNVVTVFDAGLVELDDGETTAFIAMELLEGPTLAVWLDGTRTWREVLRKFIAAGRGLAAAHRRGVVHGDFKPANVLFGRGGRPLVCDFGLARVNDHMSTEVDGAALVVRGTPGYIAPELVEGDPPSPRSDQFAFCIALHRALRSAAAGEPFGGAPLLPTALPPLPKPIPAAIESALRRGFDPDPSRRFESMDALLATLRKATRTRWYRRPSTWVLAGAVAVWAAVPRGVDPCPAAVAHQAKLQKRVVALPELQPSSAAAIATSRLHERVEAIDRLAVEACRLDDDDLAAPTLRCLARRRHELDHLVARIEDSRSAHALLLALSSMGDPAECGAEGSEADDDDAAEVDAIDDLLSASSVAEWVGDYEDAETLAEQAVARAREVDAPAALARAELRLADAVYKRGPWQAAVEHAEAAYQAALAAGAFDLAAIAASRAMLAAFQPGDDEWTRWRRHAEAALQHTDAIRPRVILASRLSIAFEREASYPEALAQAERAIEAATQMAADPATADPHLLNSSRQLRGIALFRLGRLDEAEVVLRETLAEREAQYAVDSPNLAPLRHELAVVLHSKGQDEEALALVEMNYEIERKALPPGHPDIIGSLVELAAIKRGLGRFEAAEADLQVANDQLRPDSPAMVRASVWIAQANVMSETERWAEAEAKLMGARTVLESEGDAAWHARVTVLLNLTELYRIQDEDARALQELAAALELLCPHLSEADCERGQSIAAKAGKAEGLSIRDAVDALRALGPTP